LFYETDPQQRSDDQAGASASGDSSTGATPGAATEQAGGASLPERLKVLQAEKDDLLNTLVRRQADFENYRKRVDRERQHDRTRAVENLIEKLLPVLDAFDRAIQEHDDPAYREYRKGFELIEKQLVDLLTKQGLERIDAIGKEFDPHLHHAIERAESTDVPDGTVLSVLQAGYKLHDKVLRPAMVRVAVDPATLAHGTASKKT
jgi:molecular chaperone GrpE